MNNKKEIMKGIRLMQKGYTIVADAYDDFDMMKYPFPVDVIKLADFIHDAKEKVIEDE